MREKIINWLAQRRKWRIAARKILFDEERIQIALGFEVLSKQLQNGRKDEFRSNENLQFEVSIKIQPINESKIRVFISCSPADAHPIDWIFPESMHFEIDSDNNINY